jgi:hypothetical protein
MPLSRLSGVLDQRRQVSVPFEKSHTVIVQCLARVVHTETTAPESTGGSRCLCEPMLDRLVVVRRMEVQAVSLHARLGSQRADGASDADAAGAGEGPVGRRRRLRQAMSVVITIASCLLVFAALVIPNELGRVTAGAFVRIPVELLVLLGLALLLPARSSRIVAAVFGVVLGLLTILKVIDMGFYESLDRPFNPVTDRGYFGPAVGVLSDSIGRGGAIACVIGAVVLAAALLVLMPLAVMRLTRLAAGHRLASIRTVTVLGVVWGFCAVLGVQAVSGVPVASTSAAALAYDEVRDVRDAVRDQQVFADEIADDDYADVPAAQLVAGLRGKDVVIAFVESYGRVAVEDSTISPGVDAVLDSGTERLEAAGFDSRSAFLTSPTYGGISWLAHSSLQSGLWVDNEQRYDQLMDSDRLTMSDAFKRAGWRTVADVPSNDEPWEEGKSFYDYDEIYNVGNVGYLGPAFSYASMPDQYTLSAFQRLELGRTDRPPLMAEIDLVSSHTPWTPLPRMVDWNDVGYGSVFDGMPEEGKSTDEVWPDQGRVREAYGESIEYSLDALISFVQTYGDDSLVLILLGDHQPASIVSGRDATHDVPITVIAHDPTVLDRISDWGWQEGMNPDSTAPVMPMDSFRDRFFAAYGPRPATSSTGATRDQD